MQGNWRSLSGPVATISVSLLFYFWLRSQLYLDVVVNAPNGHFYIVSLVAGLAALLSIGVGVAGIRLRNMNVTFLSLAYLSLAGIFIVHGLSTPGFMIHSSGLPGVAAQLSVLAAVMLIWISSFSTDHILMKFLSRWQRQLVPAWAGIVALFGLLTLIHPHLIEMIPLQIKPYKWVATGLTTVFSIAAMLRYQESYRLTRFPLHNLTVYSSSLLIVSQIIMVTGDFWRLSWWSYHFFLLASMLVMVIGVVRQYLALESIGTAFRVLFRAEPRAWIASSISPSVKALITATEERDAYTAGHNYRVALYGLRLAEHMKLRPDSLRALAQGGIVHDVGKNKIPDHVLNKPGKLTQDERLIIERHPVDGYNLCKRLGFMPEELSIIRSHHEKWDGSGYPDRLKGEDIPFLARIIAVADVYDALTSSRSYRKAMSHEEAMAIIYKERGTHFDPICVDAWVQISEYDPAFIANTRANGAKEQAAPALLMN
jgi:putative nucleotidyltransferase with HDIG domain